MDDTLLTTVTRNATTVTIGRDRPVTIIGERINPTGRKTVLRALEAGDFDIVRRDALAQVQAGAHVLDVNAGVPGADETLLLPQLLREVMSVVDVPLCIDTNNPQALAAALAVYEGKALVNSVNGEEKMLAAVLPLVKEHGAAVIGLCLDSDGIPSGPDGRLRVAERIIDRALGLGIPLEDIVIDPLAMSLGADSQAGRVTLEAIERIVATFGVNITLGASNISFGLPDRKHLNAAFIAMAIYAGLTCPITNPLVTEVSTAVLGADLALGRDDYGSGWIRAYRARKKAAEAAAA